MSGVKNTLYQINFRLDTELKIDISEPEDWEIDTMQRDHGEKIKWHKWGDLKHTDKRDWSQQKRSRRGVGRSA